MIHAPGGDWFQHFLDARPRISPASELVSGHSPDSRVVNNDGPDLVHLGAVRLDVFPGTEQSLFLASEKHEANGAARQETGGLDGARGVNHHRCVAAVVEGTGAQVPGIEVRAENDGFVGVFAPRIWPTTFSWSIGPPTLFGMVRRTRTLPG